MCVDVNAVQRKERWWWTRRRRGFFLFFYATGLLFQRSSSCSRSRLFAFATLLSRLSLLAERSGNGRTAHFCRSLGPVRTRSRHRAWSGLIRVTLNHVRHFCCFFSSFVVVIFRFVFFLFFLRSAYYSSGLRWNSFSVFINFFFYSRLSLIRHHELDKHAPNTWKIG